MQFAVWNVTLACSDALKASALAYILSLATDMMAGTTVALEYVWAVVPFEALRTTCSRSRDLSS